MQASQSDPSSQHGYPLNQHFQSKSPLWQLSDFFFFFLISGLLRSWQTCAKNFKRSITAKPSLPTSFNALPVLPPSASHLCTVEFCSRGSGQLKTPLKYGVSFPCCAGRWAPGTNDDAIWAHFIEPGTEYPPTCKVDAFLSFLLWRGEVAYPWATQPARRWLHRMDFIWLTVPSSHYQNHSLCDQEWF